MANRFILLLLALLISVPTVEAQPAPPFGVLCGCPSNPDPKYPWRCNTIFLNICHRAHVKQSLEHLDIMQQPVSKNGLSQAHSLKRYDPDAALHESLWKDRSLTESSIKLGERTRSTPTAPVPTDCSLESPEKGVESNVARLYFMQQLKKAELKTGGMRKKKLLCRVTLRPDGSVADIKILNPSGSETVDKDLLGLIKAASPFRPYRARSGNSYCLVEFLDHLVSLEGTNFTCDFTVKALPEGISTEVKMPVEKPKNDADDPFLAPK